jgi:colicin import membrane protein
MTTEKQGFDAGKFFDDGVADAGLESEDTGAVEDTAEAGSSESITVKPDDKGGTDEAKAEQAETNKTDKAKEKAADSSASAEDIQDALDSTETESEPDSVIEKLLPKEEEIEAAAQQAAQPDRSGKVVPLDSHVKLRERAQAAERENAELRARLDAEAGQKAEEAEKSPLEQFVEENPDEDFVPAKVQLEERRFQDRRQAARQEAARKAEQARNEAAEKQQSRANTIKAINARAMKSESEFRKATPDFDEVTKPFVDEGLLSNEERLDFLKSENPAKRLYDICKAKRDAIRRIAGTQEATAKDTPGKKPTEKKAPANPDDSAEDDLSDDEIMRELEVELKLNK